MISDLPLPIPPPPLLRNLLAVGLGLGFRGVFIVMRRKQLLKPLRTFQSRPVRLDRVCGPMPASWLKMPAVRYRSPPKKLATMSNFHLEIRPGIHITTSIYMCIYHRPLWPRQRYWQNRHPVDQPPQRPWSNAAASPPQNPVSRHPSL